MKPIEFIALHREDDEGCECLILPDGQVEEPIPSHISRLAQLTGADTAVLRKYVEKNMEPLFWLVEYTGCMSVWQTRVVSPSGPTQEQLDALEELRDAALIAPRYLREKAGEEYVKSAKAARRAVEMQADGAGTEGE